MKYLAVFCCGFSSLLYTQVHFIITLQLTWQNNKTPRWERSSKYLQTCTLIPFTISWYHMRQEPFFIIPAKKKTMVVCTLMEEYCGSQPLHIIGTGREDKQGSNCKTTVSTCTLHLLLLKGEKKKRQNKTQWNIQYREAVFDAFFFYIPGVCLF